MKTHKEVADELVEKFEEALHDSMDILKIKTNKLSKKCAIICVDKIIKSNDMDWYTEADEHNYWQQVRKELE